MLAAVVGRKRSLLRRRWIGLLRGRCGLRWWLCVVFRGRGVGHLGRIGGWIGIPLRAFAGCIFATAVLCQASVDNSREEVGLTLTSSHACIVFTPSPTFLNASFDSSSSSCTRSRTLSVSLLVPSRFISFESLEMLPDSEKSLSMCSCDSRWNSGSSAYCASFCLRVVVGWDSSEDN